MADSGYKGGASQGGKGTGEQSADDSAAYWSHEKLKKTYLDYLGLKRQEIDEQIQARRYRHGSHWTAAQIKVFNARKQPVATYNRVGRKIDSVIGLVEKLRQAPKGYPRTNKEMERGGADLATAVIRQVLDAQEWKTVKAPLAAENGATDGIGGVELKLIQGDQGDPDIGFEIVDPADFFYDPRSYKLDFSDARFKGIGKWVDVDTAIEIVPHMEKEIRDSLENGGDLTSNPDKDQKWFFSDGENTKRIRLVMEDYKHKGEWCWCLFTGSLKLMEGKSEFHDERGKTISRFRMFSANVDQDGDRYGFVRNMKSAQDEINMRRSKGLHILNSRALIAEAGAFNDIEEARVEAARPDMVLQPNPGKKVEFDDQNKLANLEGQIKFLEDAKMEIDSFGPNPQLTGQGITKDQSGRAIALLQQAGIAELGPFIIAYRSWKIGLYRDIWNATREHWKAERAIRVTDDEKAVNFIQVNSVGIDPMTGMPTLVNTLGALDVDIILDEGPDSINLIQDTHDALMALAQSGANVPPDIMMEFMPGLDPETKKRLIERIQKAEQNPAQELQLKELMAKVEVLMADSGLKKAQTAKAYHDAQMPPEMAGQGGGEQQHPSMMMAEIQEKMASATLKQAQSQKAQADTEKSMADRAKIIQDIQLEPQRMAMEQHNQEADRAQQAYQSNQQLQQQAVDSQRNAEINKMKAKQKPVSRPSAR